MSRFSGETWAELIEVRFASSGKVASVIKRTGDTVKKWGILANLDKKILQAELDQQLAYYEKTRAEFEIFNKKSTDISDIGKYSKTIEQSQLNASVKGVELAKARLDQSDLISPIDGIVVSDGGCRVGIYITPASATYQILDVANTIFRLEISDKDLDKFSQPQKVKIVLTGNKKRSGVTKFPIPKAKGGFLVDITLDDNKDLLPGIKGNVLLS